MLIVTHSNSQLGYKAGFLSLGPEDTLDRIIPLCGAPLCTGNYLAVGLPTHPSPPPYPRCPDIVKNVSTHCQKNLEGQSYTLLRAAVYNTKCNWTCLPQAGGGNFPEVSTVISSVYIFSAISVYDSMYTHSPLPPYGHRLKSTPHPQIGIMLSFGIFLFKMYLLYLCTSLHLELLRPLVLLNVNAIVHWVPALSFI